MEANTKFHLYDLKIIGKETDLKQRLKRLNRKNLADRLKMIDRKEYRAEKITFSTIDGADVCFLNFVYARQDGPGKLSPVQETSGIGLKSDEKFSEEAAVMLDFTNNTIIGEYNHHGGKVVSFTKYISSHVFSVKGQNTTISAYARLHEDAESRLRNKKNPIFRSLDVRLRPEKIDLKKLGANNTSIDRVLESLHKEADSLDGETVYLHIGSSDSSGLKSSGVKSFFNSLMKLVKLDASEEPKDCAVATLRTKVKGSDEDNAELLDFLNAKKYLEEQITIGADRRKPWDRRKRAIERAYREWKRNNEF